MVAKLRAKFGPAMSGWGVFLVSSRVFGRIKRPTVGLVQPGAARKLLQTPGNRCPATLRRISLYPPSRRLIAAGFAKIFIKPLPVFGGGADPLRLRLERHLMAANFV